MSTELPPAGNDQPNSMEQRGDPIPGSTLFRDFCAICGEAIRVPDKKRGLARNFCLTCMRTAVHKLAEAVQKEAAEKAAPPQTPAEASAPDADDNRPDYDDDESYDFDAETP